ncbi:copper resistance protein [Helcobacillus massiliensis]|uniref:copper homeostasis protein CutC n=1 Tax=Helcobacillus massiliensis TaxID=521392 RepID=UPI0021A25E9B|nr:copper homeostasis protein CutC [Helcobacillus massiliensis]MCT1558371.1 copper resistance protein [Helcobacillus massiliensis]MCT2036857.1 copper resistance protein [Helcobacillus massiliensis]MCT2332638.1 copper resistance protein [Helcobacillus massiliensis]
MTDPLADALDHTPERARVQLEIAVQDLPGLVVAAHGGADRVELCVDLEADGLTPPIDLTRAAVALADDLVASRDARPLFGVHVLVRSRPGSFVYSADEIEQMRAQAVEAVRAGAHGIVIGALTGSADATNSADSAGSAEPALDMDALTIWRDAALAEAQAQGRSLQLTCHRAIDRLTDAARIAAVTDLFAAGFHRILTSGGADRAPDGTDCLRAMVEQAEDLIDIQAGAGIRAATTRDLLQATGVPAVHLSARGTEPQELTDVPAALRALLKADGRSATAPTTLTDPAQVRAIADLLDL